MLLLLLFFFNSFHFLVAKDKSVTTMRAVFAVRLQSYPKNQSFKIRKIAILLTVLQAGFSCCSMRV